MGSRFELHAAELQRGLSTLDPRVHAALGVLLQREAALAEAYMKVNAPWTDRTTNARSSLSARVTRAGDGWALILFGRAAYQIWLEISNDAKYAIITPTITLWGRRVMRNTEGLLNRLGVTR